MTVNFEPDFSMYIYPMHVLSTNRILNTIISRKENFRGPKLFDDLKDVYRLRGLKGYFFGIVPYSLNYFMNNVQFFGNADEEFNDPQGYKWFVLTMLLWNPINILIVRMQSLEFSHRQFRKALLDMIRVDRFRMFYTGFFPIFYGQLLLRVCMQAATIIEPWNHKSTPFLCGSLFIVGCLLSHPFYLIGMRVQYGRFHQREIERQASKNIFTQIAFLKSLKDKRQFYKGFVPAFFIYVANQFNDLKRMTYDRIKS